MKKLILIIMIMLFPIQILADNSYEVTTHIINANVEIAGALHVEELIVIKGNTDYLNRKLNYYSFGTSKWNGTDEIDYNGSEFYNGHSISITNVAVFDIDTSEIDINDLDKNKTSSLKEFDIKNPSNKGYSFKDNEDGTASLNVMYPIKGEMAIYIEYSVNNIVVKHNDVKELNYTFKNLNLNSKETIVRVITPYVIDKEDEDLYNVWIHGSRTGQFQEIENTNEEKLGIYGIFEETEEFNIRMTLPQDYVGIDMYLTKSNEDALDKIVAVENTRLNNTEKKNSILDNMIYFLVIVSVVFLIAVILISYFKLLDKRIYILLFIFSILICIFNYLFYQFKYFYLYIIILVPLLGKIITNKRK